MKDRVRRLLCALGPRRRFSSCLRSARRVSVASSTQMSVSAPRRGVRDFTFSTSSRPRKSSCAPFERQVTLSSLLLMLNMWDRPKREMLFCTSAKQLARSVRATWRTTRVLRPASASSTARAARKADLPEPAPPKNSWTRWGDCR